MAPRDSEARSWVFSGHSLSQPLFWPTLLFALDSCGPITLSPYLPSLDSALDYLRWIPALLSSEPPLFWPWPTVLFQPCPILTVTALPSPLRPPAGFPFPLCSRQIPSPPKPLFLVTFLKALSPAGNFRIVPFPCPTSLSVLRGKEGGGTRGARVSD